MVVKKDNDHLVVVSYYVLLGFHFYFQAFQPELYLLAAGFKSSFPGCF